MYKAVCGTIPSESFILCQNWKLDHIDILLMLLPLIESIINSGPSPGAKFEKSS